MTINCRLDNIVHTFIDRWHFAAYYVFAVEERNRISYVETNKIANTIEMYQLYGAVVVMTLSALFGSYEQKVLIEAVKQLSEIDTQIRNSGSTIDYINTKIYITGNL